MRIFINNRGTFGVSFSPLRGGKKGGGGCFGLIIILLIVFLIGKCSGNTDSAKQEINDIKSQQTNNTK